MKKKIKTWLVLLIAVCVSLPLFYLEFRLSGGSASLMIKFVIIETAIIVPICSIINKFRSSSDMTSSCNSTADELLKYKKLLDDGALTPDEFNRMKKQLLER